MQSSDFDYELPGEKIARYPVSPRRKAKLLRAIPPNSIYHNSFENLVSILSDFGCDGLWANDTKVLQARLYMKKPTGGRIEIFLLEPINGVTEQSLAAIGQTTWRCLIRGGRRWKSETAELVFDDINLKVRPADIEKGLVKEEGGTFALTFVWQNSICFGDILDVLGRTPLPPYMKRESEDSDKNEYQTVFARLPGSVAAPTAGLHFDEILLSQLKQQDLPLNHLTLHVGAGTFKPLSDGKISDHIMHAERCVIDRSILKKLKAQTKRVATGTTTLRTLESIFWMAVYHKEYGEFPEVLPQWIPYEMDDSEMSYNECLEYLEGVVSNDEPWSFQTQIMIKPGYKIRSIAGLITNFHQPNSTLLCLVSACLESGNHTQTWKELYGIALKEGYRFLSYGDGCLIELV